MKVLIIKDYTTTAPWGPAMITSFSSHITQRTPPTPQIDICAAANAAPLPDPAQYDLIILTGGTVNLITGPRPDWVHPVLDLIRTVARGDRVTKLLGCCWGHQAIQCALGGELGVVQGGPRIGIEELRLTAKGKEWFGREALRLHKHHKRMVTQAAVEPKMVLLAENNEILMADTGKVLSFQAHPEFTAEIAQGLVEGDDGSYTGGGASFQGEMSGSHDGGLVWDRIMEWAVTE